MLLYAKHLPVVSEECDVILKSASYFGQPRARMRYANCIARDSPNESGPTESATKNIAQATLKRSRMRWSLEVGQSISNRRVKHPFKLRGHRHPAAIKRRDGSEEPPACHPYLATAFELPQRLISMQSHSGKTCASGL
jgi:hypothetical protein